MNLPTAKTISTALKTFSCDFVLLLQTDGEYAKYRLAKFKEIKKESFLLHLKEYKFRFNNSKDTKTFYHILLKMIRENPLKLS